MQNYFPNEELFDANYYRSHLCDGLNYNCEVYDEDAYDDDEDDSYDKISKAELTSCFNAIDENYFGEECLEMDHDEIDSVVRKMRLGQNQIYSGTSRVSESLANSGFFRQVDDSVFTYHKDSDMCDDSSEHFGSNGPSDDVFYGRVPLSHALVTAVEKPRNYSRAEALTALTKHTGVNLTKDICGHANPIVVSQICASMYSQQINADYVYRNADVEFLPAERYVYGTCSVYPPGEDISHLRNLMPYSGDHYFKRVPLPVAKTSFGVKFPYSTLMYGIVSNVKVTAIVKDGDVLVRSKKRNGWFVLILKLGDACMGSVPYQINGGSGAIDTYHNLSEEGYVNVRHLFEVAEHDRNGLFSSGPSSYCSFEGAPYDAFFRTVGPAIPSVIYDGKGFKMYTVGVGIRWHLVIKDIDPVFKQVDNHMCFTNTVKPRFSRYPRRAEFVKFLHVYNGNLVLRKYSRSYSDADMSVSHNVPDSLMLTRQGQLLGNRSLYKRRPFSAVLRTTDVEDRFVKVDVKTVQNRTSFGDVKVTKTRFLNEHDKTIKISVNTKVLDSAKAMDYGQRYCQSDYEKDLTREGIEPNPGPPLLEIAANIRLIPLPRPLAPAFVVFGDNFIAQQRAQDEYESDIEDDMDDVDD